MARVGAHQRDVARCSTSEVQAWIAGLSAGQVDADGTVVRRPLAPSTVSVAYGKLAAIFRAAVEDRVLPHSPCTRRRLPGPEVARWFQCRPSRSQR
jgi:hypothetical protein